MKKLLIILGSIILGVYIVSTWFVSSNSPSFKSQAQSVVNKANTEIQSITQ